MKKHRIDPEGKRLPIKLDSTSNGEFVPVPLSPANRGGRTGGLSAGELKRYAARDSIARRRAAYLQRPEPHFLTYGPKA